MWKSERTFKQAGASGFTLVEVMVASVVSLIVLSATLAAFVFLGGSSLRIGHYNDMESQSRQLLQQFSQDARQASDASWTNVYTLKLTVAGTPITYAYDEARQTLTRSEVGKTADTVASGLTDLKFQAFQVTGSELPLATVPTAVGPATKMIQINLSLAQGNKVVGNTSSQLISARCVLRNKKLN